MFPALSSSSALVPTSSLRPIHVKRQTSTKRMRRVFKTTKALLSEGAFSSSSSVKVAESKSSTKTDNEHEKLQSALTSLLLSATIFFTSPLTSQARLEGVNNPKLLPDGPQSENLVIDVAGYLTPREVKRLQTRVENLQRDTGVKLRILAQAYPQTPGLAIKDYWGVDDDTVVFVADPGLGNILNFSIGANVDLEVPPNFWTKLANKYGTKFYWADKGEEASIVAAVDAIEFCLNEPSGRAKCTTVLDVDKGIKEDMKREAKTNSGGFNLKLPF